MNLVCIPSTGVLSRRISTLLVLSPHCCKMKLQARGLLSKPRTTIIRTFQSTLRKVRKTKYQRKSSSFQISNFPWWWSTAIHSSTTVSRPRKSWRYMTSLTRNLKSWPGVRREETIKLNSEIRCLRCLRRPMNVSSWTDHSWSEKRCKWSC